MNSTPIDSELLDLSRDVVTTERQIARLEKKLAALGPKPDAYEAFLIREDLRGERRKLDKKLDAELEWCAVVDACCTFVEAPVSR